MIAVLIENDVVVTPLAQLEDVPDFGAIERELPYDAVPDQVLARTFEVAEKGGTFFQIMAPAGNSMYIYVLDAVVYYMFISSIKGD